MHYYTPPLQLLYQTHDLNLMWKEEGRSLGMVSSRTYALSAEGHRFKPCLVSLKDFRHLEDSRHLEENIFCLSPSEAIINSPELGGQIFCFSIRQLVKLSSPWLLHHSKSLPPPRHHPKWFFSSNKNSHLVFAAHVCLQRSVSQMPIFICYNQNDLELLPHLVLPKGVKWEWSWGLEQCSCYGAGIQAE